MNPVQTTGAMTLAPPPPKKKLEDNLSHLLLYLSHNPWSIWTAC